MAGKKIDTDARYYRPVAVSKPNLVPVVVKQPGVSPFRVGFTVAHWLVCRAVILALDLTAFITVLGIPIWFAGMRWDDDSNRNVFKEWVFNWNPLTTLSNIKQAISTSISDWWFWVIERSRKD